MTRTQVQLLVSVRTVGEAQAALTGGVDIIDVKEPLHGSLGRANDATIAAVVREVAGRRPVSAALGELAESGADDGIPAGVRFVKAGLANASVDWPRRLARHAARTGAERTVAVIYADHQRAGAPAPAEVIAWACEHRPAGLLVDTFVKDGRSLFDFVDDAGLAEWAVRAHDHDLFLALAGSLRGALVERAVETGADIVAVRGAACAEGERNGAIAADRVRALAELIAAHHAATVSSAG